MSISTRLKLCKFASTIFEQLENDKIKIRHVSLMLHQNLLLGSQQTDRTSPAPLTWTMYHPIWAKRHTKIWTNRTVINKSIVQQVTWLVITEIWSKSFGLVTECHHYNTHPMYALWGQFCFSPPSVVSCAVSAHAHAMRVFDVWASSPPRLPLCQISFLLHSLLLSLPADKNQINNHLLTQLICLAKKLLLRKNQLECNMQYCQWNTRNRNKTDFSSRQL